jgi:hypothetical protein
VWGRNGELFYRNLRGDRMMVVDCEIDQRFLMLITTNQGGQQQSGNRFIIVQHSDEERRLSQPSAQERQTREQAPDEVESGSFWLSVRDVRDGPIRPDATANEAVRDSKPKARKRKVAKKR